MLNELKLQSFDKRVGESFEIDFGETGKLAAELIDATASKAPSMNREPFSLFFQCPYPAPQQQGVYKVSHATVGEIDLFLVPIRVDDDGVVFEAVFN